MTPGSGQFADIYARHYRRVYMYCRRRVNADRLDDVVAETFLTAWRMIDVVPQGEDALPWLYAVAYRAVSRQWRSRSRQQQLAKKLASIGVETVPGADDYLVVRHDSSQVLAAMSRLRPREQEILRLVYWEELSQADIASALGISIGAVRQRLYNAKRHLTRQYDRMEARTNLVTATGEGSIR